MKILTTCLPVLYLLVLCCAAPAGRAAAPTAIVTAGERFALQGHLDYLPDSADADSALLLTGHYDHDFRRYDDRAVNFQRAPVWLRVRVTNNTASDQLILSARDVLFADAILLYQHKAADGQTVTSRTEAGLMRGHVEKRWHYHDIAFPVQVEPGGTRTLYLYLHTPYFLLLDPYVADETTYAVYQAQQASCGHLMVGIMLGLLLYLVMIALYVRGLSEVRHCIAFVGVSLLVLLYGRGYLFSLLPHSAWLNIHLYSLIFSAQAFTYISFSRRHFKTQQDFPLIDRLLMMGEVLAAVLFLASMFMPVHSAIIAVAAMVFLLVTLLCITSVYVWANSDRRITVYVIGSLSFLFACILAMAENSGMINLNGLSRHGYEAGLCLQTILFALALAEKISVYQKDQVRLAIHAAEAQAENRAKSSFLAKMSHELRTPMNGLLGMLQLLESTRMNDQQRHYTQVMRNSGRVLLGVIDDVLDYSRIVAGKLRIEESDYDLSEVLGDVEAMFTSSAKQKQLHLRFSIASQPPFRVRGDVVRLRQILINLVGNAVKFTESGSVAVRVSLERNESAVWLLHGEVEDTGIGITAVQMQQLFHEYAQVDGGARRYGGSGLGLAICKQLVEMMHGSIHAESAPGYGSLFRFHIQVKPPQDDVVIAADHENRQPGSCWDLVLMDLEMPVMDGLSAAQHIRAWEAEQCRDAIPIIALTAHAVRGYEEKSMQAGMDDYLSKPIDLRQLQALLAKWLPGSSETV